MQPEDIGHTFHNLTLFSRPCFSRFSTQTSSLAKLQAVKAHDRPTGMPSTFSHSPDNGSWSSTNKGPINLYTIPVGRNESFVHQSKHFRPPAICSELTLFGTQRTLIRFVAWMAIP